MVSQRAQLDLLTWKPPAVAVSTIRIPQPDGSLLLRAGKLVVVEEMIGTAEVARILSVSQRWVENECSLGNFKTAYKPGIKRGSFWKIARIEVESRKQSPVD